MRPETPEHARQRKEILELIDAAGLSNHRDLIAGHLKPGIGLRTRASGPSAGIGVTKVGGEPDLPDGVAWPTFEGEPSLFVLQIDFEVIAPLDLEELLPADGLLSVFTDRFNDDVRVLYHPKGSMLTRRAWEPTVRGAFPECLVDVLAELHVPPARSNFADFLDEAASGDQFDDYSDHVCLVWRERQRPGRAGEAGIHQLLGFAHGDGEHHVGEEVLIGFDSDDRAGMEWGDVHCVWALMKRESLAARAWGHHRIMM